MDEIASKYYVETETCFLNISLDTVTFCLFQSDTSNMDLLAEIPLHLTNRGERWLKEEYCIEGNCGRLKVSVNPRGMFVQIDSMGKYLYGDFMHDFSFGDVERTFRIIAEKLGISFDQLRNAKVRRLDVAVDIQTERSPAIYINQLLSLPRYDKLTFTHGITFKTDRKELALYDKGVKEKITDRNILRYELRIHKIKQVFGQDVEISRLCDPTFWNGLLEMELSTFQQIKKEKYIPCDEIIDIRSLQKVAVLYFIREKGYDSLMKELEANEKDGIMSKRNRRAVQQYINSVYTATGDNSSPEMEELSMKLRHVIESKKITL